MAARTLHLSGKPLAFLVVVGLCLAVGAGVASAEPFKTSGSSHIGSETGIPPFTLSSGVARGTMLGRSTFSGQISTTSGLVPPACGDGFTDISGALDIRAANGDQLYLTLAGGNCQSAIVPMSFRATGPYSIAGGTGRFATAIGTGLFSAHSVFDTGPGPGGLASGSWVFAVNGTIDR